MGHNVCFVCGEHLPLDGGVSEASDCPADEEEDYSPGEEVGGDEKDQG